MEDSALRQSALAFAMDVSKRAAGLGFDWAQARDVLDKVREETDEIAQALAQSAGPGVVGEELGDLLFSVVNLARKLGLDPERCLREATQKFSRRFEHVERLIAARAAQGDPPPTDAELDHAWRFAKTQDPQTP